MKYKFGLIGTLIAAALMGSAPAHAAPVLGSHVDSADWTTAIGSTSGWSFMGDNVGAFTGPGIGELELRLSSFGNTFGYARTDHSNKTQVFSTGAGIGSTSAIAGFSPNYLFYFAADASGLFGPIFDNSQFTDGYSTGGLFGQANAAIDIFFNSGQNQWAFFFDDSGPISLNPDDNDYNDMVVTFRQAVPEPMSLSLVGLGLLGAGFMRRRKA